MITINFDGEFIEKKERLEVSIMNLNKSFKDTTDVERKEKINEILVRREAELKKVNEEIIRIERIIGTTSVAAAAPSGKILSNQDEFIITKGHVAPAVVIERQIEEFYNLILANNNNWETYQGADTIIKVLVKNIYDRLSVLDTETSRLELTTKFKKIFEMGFDESTDLKKTIDDLRLIIDLLETSRRGHTNDDNANKFLRIIFDLVNYTLKNRDIEAIKYSLPESDEARQRLHKLSKLFGRISSFLPMSGGGSNYREKYLKYKKKYLELKNKKY